MSSVTGGLTQRNGLDARRTSHLGGSRKLKGEELQPNFKSNRYAGPASIMPKVRGQKISWKISFVNMSTNLPPVLLDVDCVDDVESVGGSSQPEKGTGGTSEPDVEVSR